MAVILRSVRQPERGSRRAVQRNSAASAPFSLPPRTRIIFAGNGETGVCRRKVKTRGATLYQTFNWVLRRLAGMREHRYKFNETGVRARCLGRCLAVNVPTPSDWRTRGDFSNLPPAATICLESRGHALLNPSMIEWRDNARGRECRQHEDKGAFTIARGVVRLLSHYLRVRACLFPFDCQAMCFFRYFCGGVKPYVALGDARGANER